MWGLFRTTIQSHISGQRRLRGIFTNYKNVVDTFYPDVPFGIAQQGKSCNEISPRDFVFRSREFEQMEIEYFVHPEAWQESFEMWVELCKKWFAALGLPEASVHELEVPEADRAHYSKRTIDFEFDYPIGREELMGLVYRSDFDLGNIQRVSGKSMEYRPQRRQRTICAACDRTVIWSGTSRHGRAVQPTKQTNKTVKSAFYLALPEHLAPVKYCVSPLLKNKPELVAKAREVYAQLKQNTALSVWDDNGNIGKRYRRQDEIGTLVLRGHRLPNLCEDDTVTARHRDTTEQTRKNIADLLND